MQFRNGITQINSGSQDYIDIPRPSEVVEGDFLVVMILANDTSYNYTPNAMFTKQDQTAFSSFYTAYLYTGFVPASPPSFWHWDGPRSTYAAGVLLAYSGVDTSNPFSNLAKGTSLGSRPYYGHQTPTADDQIMVITLAGFDFDAQTSVNWVSSDGTVRSQGYHYPVDGSLLTAVGVDHDGLSNGVGVDTHADPSPATLNVGAIYSLLLNNGIHDWDLSGTSSSASTTSADLATDNHAIDYYSQPQFRGGILLSEISTPERTPSNSTMLYAGTDGYLYAKSSSGDIYGVAPPPQQFNQAANTTFTSAGYLPYTGGPTLTVNVPASGCIQLTYGFVGTVNSNVTSAQVYVDVVFSGTNSKPANDTGSAVMMFGRGTNNDLSVERDIVFTGLNPGSTDITLCGHFAGSGVDTANTIRESWLIAKVHP